MIFFIVSHVSLQRTASRNSHCVARGRGKRPLENPKNPIFFPFYCHLSFFVPQLISNNELKQPFLV